MLLNNVLEFCQKHLNFLYEKSLFLKNIDLLILLSIIGLISFSGFSSSDSIANFAIITIFLTVIKFITKKGELFYISKSDIFLLIYFLIVLISVAGSTYLMYSIKGFFKTLVYLGFYVSFVQFLKDNKNKLIYIFIAFVLVGFFESFVAIMQNFNSVSEISGWQDVSRLNPEDVITRVYGTLKPYNPNLFGGYMLSILPVPLFFVYKTFKNNMKNLFLISILFLLLIVVSVFLTGCRGAYIGLFMQLLFIFILLYNFVKLHYRKIFLMISGLVVSAIFSIILCISSLRTRLFSIFAMRNDSSNSFRFNVYKSCFEMFKDNWLLGIGVGNQNFREIYGLYMKTGFDALSAYNIYLETALESGIFALISFLGFVIANFVNGIKFIFVNKKTDAVYVFVALTSIIGILTHGITDTVFFRPQIQFVFWIMIGIVSSFVSNKELAN